MDKEKEFEEGLLSSKPLIKAVKLSQKYWKAKKYSEFIPWKNLKKKHSL